MKNFLFRILILSGVLFCALFVSCSSEGSSERSGEAGKASSGNAALLAASKMPAVGPDRVEVLWYKAVMFSSRDSADIYRLAHIVSQAEKDSAKARVKRARERAKELREHHAVIERPVLLLSEDPIHINLYRGDELKEEIFFRNNQAPYALKEFLDRKGVTINGAVYDLGTIKSLPDSLHLTGGQGTMCRSVIRTPGLSDIKATPAVDDSVKLKIKKVLAQRTPSIRHLWNKHIKKLQKQFPWEEFPEELRISMQLNQGGVVYKVNAQFAEPPKKISGGRQKFYDDYLKDVENSIRHWKFPPPGLKKYLRLEFPLYPFSSTNEDKKVPFR